MHDERERGDERPVETTTSAMLREALGAMDPAMLARFIGVEPERLPRWANGRESMTFVERMAATMGVIALAPAGSDLFRRAARLRAQLAASLEFELGVTKSSADPPHLR